MSRTPVYEHHTPDAALWHLRRLHPIYASVFSQPPYNEGPEIIEKFPDWLTRESARPGFSLVTAELIGEIVGFAYGYTMAPGDWWRRANPRPTEELKRAEKFAVMECAVHPEHRGRGIGRHLLSDLLTGRNERWATLAVNPAAPARAIYEGWGWEHIATTAAHQMPAMDVMVLPLPMTPDRAPVGL